MRNAQRSRIPFWLLHRAAVVPGEVHDRTTDDVIRVALALTCFGDPEDERECVGRARGEVPKDVPDLVHPFRRVGQDAPVQVGSERLEPELERCRDPEVPAGAAEAPEELRLIRLRRPNESAVGGDELDGCEVVDREAEMPLQSTDAATEREARDAGVADDADRADQAMFLRSDVELAKERTPVGSREATRRIDLDATHVRQVDD